jgi:HTH-type transcriptional repressor of NAD biosynthesis genes
MAPGRSGIVSTRFQRGLAVGKFAPLHRGHELVIRRAFAECDEVVLLSYSKPEMPGCPPELRERWLATLFPKARRLVATDERLRAWASLDDCPASVPPNDAPAAVHHAFCAFLCQCVLGVTVDAVFTSEAYGDDFALGLARSFRLRDPSSKDVRHVMVDCDRREVPVSGTLLRGALHENRKWLAPEVYASFVKRVCLLGGESSGKTSLSEALARELETLHAAEFARELWDARSGDLRFDDMLRIARAQVAREEDCARRANVLLFCDTSPLTTLFYSRYMFGHAEPALEALARRTYDVTILCAPDFPFVQDGTRQDAAFRQLQHDWYLRELSDRGVPFVLATGPLADRVALVRRALESD